MMVHEKKCYLCGESKFKKRLGSVRDKPELEIFECKRCGIVFLSSFDHIKEGFYAGSEMHGNEVPDIDLWLKETEWDDQRRFQYLKSILPNSSLLDFGCGAGGFILKARELTAEAHGVEPEKRMNSHFQNNNITVFQNISEISQDFLGRGYDIITMFHVLEHISDPKFILHELCELLAEGGQLIVEVPNADDALLTLYNNEPFSHFTYWSCHLFLFTSKTLAMLISQAGLRINYIKQIQRYPLSNHLYWLANGKPGGHRKWLFLDSPELHTAYEKQLAAMGKCDTILASISRY